MRIFLFLVMMTVCIRSVEAAEIRVVASPGLSTAFKVLGPQFERATGHTLTFQYGLEVAQKKYIDAGDFDLAIVPSPVLDNAIKDGKIAADTRTPLANVELGVGIRAGTAKPDLISVDAFKRALVAAKSVGYVTNEATGRKVAQDFEVLAIADVMKAKTKPQETVARVWQAVANGDVEFGFGFTSNLLSVPGVEFAGRFPTELQYSVTIVSGIGIAAREVDAAKAFIKYMRGPEAAAVLRAKGLEPSAP
jgi:molybdate transport system substrate-binding protein